jgi:hypothetical protein
MNSVVVCICCRNVSKDLVNLLNSLDKLIIPHNFKIEAIIVINNKNKKYKNSLKFKRLKISFFYELKVGIPSARNKCLKVIKNKKFKYGSFLDDDCIVDKDWLVNHLNLLEENKNIDIVTGPQFSKSNKLFHKIIMPNYHHKQYLKWAATNNVIFKKKIINSQLKFDESLNIIGGSDQLFFKKLNKKGFNILWNSKSIVFEKKYSSRDKFRWFLKRCLRYGSSGVIIDKAVYGLILGNILSSSKILYLIILPVIKIYDIFFNFKKFVLFFLMSYTKALGRMMGILGIYVYDYKNDLIEIKNEKK